MADAAARLRPRAARPSRAARTARRYGLVLLLLAPWLVGLVAFFVVPMAASLWYSLCSYNLINPPRYIGLENYRYMLLDDPTFWQAVRNTLWMMAIALPIRLVTALGAAMLLSGAGRSMRWYRTILFLPSMTPPVVGVLAFSAILTPAGPFNHALGRLGIDGPLWFNDPSWSKWGLVLLGVWGIGDAMVIYMAGLLSVPRVLYEAATIDGAGALARFRHVTLPMMSPVLFFSLVMGLIGMSQIFLEGYVASSVVNGNTGQLGAPGGSLLFYALKVYVEGFRAFHMGYASALGWVLFAFTLLLTLLVLRTSRYWVHYSGAEAR